MSKHSTDPAKRVNHQKELLKRLAISFWDLTDAKNYASYIISKNLHSLEGAENEILHKGMNTALILAYSRPFSGNNQQPGKVGEIPEKYWRQSFTEEPKLLHKRITKRNGLRNKFFAHSDSEALGITIHLTDIGAVPIMHNPFVPLSKQETLLLLAMIEKLLAQLSAKQIELQSEFPAGTKL